MAKNFEHVSHIKSQLTRDIIPEEFHGLTPTADNSDAEGSSPVKLNLAKRPTADKLVEGEIAVNYLKGHETLTIKNTKDEIVGFVNENEFNQAQEIIAGAIAQEKEERLSSISSLEQKFSDVDDVTDDLRDEIDGMKNELQEDIDTLKDDVDDMELVISAALNDLNSRIEEGGSISDEEVRTINNRLSTLETNDTNLNSAIQTEAARAKAAETAIDSVAGLTKDASGESRTYTNTGTYIGKGETNTIASDIAALDTQLAANGGAIGDILDDLAEMQSAIGDGLKTYRIVELATPASVNTLHEYKIQEKSADSDWSDVTGADNIVVPKDSSLQEVYLGASTDTIDATTGTITKNTVEDPQSMNFAYQLANGNYSLTKIDVSKFLTESEFGNGFDVNGGVVSVKLDETTEDFISVGADGIKISGVQEAIDGAVDDYELVVSAALNDLETRKANKDEVTTDVASAVESAINGLNVTDTAVAGQYVSSVSEANGKISVSRANLADIALNGYTKGDDSGAVKNTDTINEAISKLENQIDNVAVAAGGTFIVEKDQSATHLTITSSTDTATNTKTYTIGENNIASASDLTTEVARAKSAETAIDGAVGLTKGANDETRTWTPTTNYGGSTTSVKGNMQALDTQVKANADDIDTLEGNVSDLQGDVSDLQGDVSDLQAAISSGINSYTIIEKTESLPTNVAHRYKLQQTSGTTVTEVGANIDIPKDSSLKEVYLGANTDTIDATTGVITKNTVTDPQSMNFAYQLADGTYSLTKIDVSKFLTESEFGNGLVVNGGVVSVKIDNNSADAENFISVGADGVKISGVQDAIDGAISDAVGSDGAISDAINNAVEALDVTDTAVDSQYVTKVDETNGVVSVARADVSAAKLNNYAKGSDATAVAATDTINQAISKLENQVDALETNVTDTFEEMDLVVSSSLNDLNQRLNEKQDIINILQAQIANLEARLTALEGN